MKRPFELLKYQAAADMKQPLPCPKCGRPCDPWPLTHNGCSPKDWAMCIRNA